MRNAPLNIVAIVVIAVIAIVVFVALGSRNKTTATILVGSSDIAVGETVAYHDFHTCLLPDGRLAYELHFGGADRSRRAQFVARLDNLGRRTMRVVTNDRTLPKGHVRLVLETVPSSNLEGHSFGTAWSRETFQINPRRPIRPAAPIPPCGPER